MTQYIDKSAVVAEIKRRISLFQKEKKTEKWSAAASQMNVISLGARVAALEEFLSFLDTLEVKEVEEEPVSNDLEEAVNVYIGHAPDIDESLSISCERKAFKAGAQWQKEQIIDKACEWLRTNYEDIGIRYIRGYKAEDEIESFKKAMEG